LIEEAITIAINRVAAIIHVTSTVAETRIRAYAMAAPIATITKNINTANKLWFFIFISS
jgi:hypothetical protein